LTFGTRQTIADGNGRYTVVVPSGDYEVEIENEPARATMLLRTSPLRGDLFVNGGDCHSRYGLVVNRATGLPVSAANVRMAGDTKTGADGWYRLDAGCGSCGGCPTTMITVTAPGYVDFSTVVGRGVKQVVRLDLAIQPR